MSCLVLFSLEKKYLLNFFSLLRQLKRVYFYFSYYLESHLDERRFVMEVKMYLMYDSNRDFVVSSGDTFID